MKSMTWGQFAVALGMGTAITAAYLIGTRDGRLMAANGDLLENAHVAGYAFGAGMADVIGSKVADTDGVQGLPVDAAHRRTTGTTDTPGTDA